MVVSLRVSGGGLLWIYCVVYVGVMGWVMWVIWLYVSCDFDDVWRDWWLIKVIICVRDTIVYVGVVWI